jgi:3-methyladenine DNA glycosylase/8-oxoguanine DNA glycosylase
VFSCASCPDQDERELRLRRAKVAPTPAAAEGATAEGPSLLLTWRPPVALEPLRRFLAASAVPGLDRLDPVTGAHTRSVPTPAGPAAVTVEPADGAAVRVTIHPGADTATVLAAVRRWLALDADPSAPDTALAADPELAPLVTARPGLRVPGAVDGVETALLTVIGQQVSLAAARTFAGRLVAAFGEPAPLGLLAFPNAQRLADAGAAQLQAATGVTHGRARTLAALAEAAADGLALHEGADRAVTRSALLALPGIGPWTADYVALRVLGDADAFPADDLVLRRAMGVRTAREAVARAEAWRPWRGHALLHLWTREVFT